MEKNAAQSRRLAKEIKKDQVKRDVQGSTFVTCSICLTWTCRLDNLRRHVKACHPESWKVGANRNHFALKADAAQLEASSVKHDPKEEEKESAPGDDDEVLEVAEVIAGFFTEDFPLSQDDVFVFGCLCELLEDQSKTDLVKYFKTDEAK